MLGLENIPAIIGEFTDAEVLEINLIENLQREELALLEEVTAYEKLGNLYGSLSRDELAERIGQRTGLVVEDIEQKLKLLSLPVLLKEALNIGLITEKQALVLQKIKHEELLMETLSQVINEKLNLTQTENLVEEIILKI